MVFNPYESFLTRPTCPSCGSPLHEGITSIYDEEKCANICTICKTIVSKR